MKVGGIVLCGGRSSRMGQPKAWLPFGGETLLQRTVRTVREVVEPVIVVAAPGQDVPLLPEEVRIVRDEVEGQGPLGGLAAGLAALEGAVDAAYLSACDVPFLTAEFVRRVIELLQKPHPPTPFPAREGEAREEPNPPTPFPAREGGASSGPVGPRGIVRGQRVTESKLDCAKELRREMTPAERLLWQRLRRNQLGGLHFRRQQVIVGFIADFYCHAAGLVVEVDGPIHDFQVEQDGEREQAFRAIGLVVLRLSNEDVLRRMEVALQRIRSECTLRMQQSISEESPSFSPAALGEGPGEGFLSSEPNPPTPFPSREGGAESFSPPALGEGPGEGFFKVAVPRVGEFFHPLAAVYRITTLPHVRELLAAERLRMQNLFDEVPTRIIEAHELTDIDPDFRSLRNVNTPEDYEAALRELRAAD